MNLGIWITRNGGNYMYTGQFVKGIRSGKGTLRDKSSRKVIYKGGWENDQYGGLGVLNQNGIEYHGNFDCGKKVKQLDLNPIQSVLDNKID